MSGKLSRNKGKNYELEIAKKLKAIFPNCGRKLEFQKDEANGVDLKNTEPYLFQLKRYKDYCPISKIFEIQSNNKGIPVLITRGDRKPDMAVLPLEAFLEMLRELKNGNNTSKEANGL